MVWPDYFPKECPIGAKGKEIEVYRLVDNDPPTESDFIPNFISQPGRKFSDDCQACGLSVFKNLDDAIHQNNVLAESIYFQRKGLPKKKIAKGISNSKFGQIKDTPAREHTSHVTYWVFKDKNIESHFKVI
ncbi:hypothetical protein [Neobacillus mesonae]|uniref:hypothetical protein n=1 Tax=Neobacillus mesonae TaxID=1193713 RepID=UPI0025736CBF|nr:hypothetical protein [Neobacillus mesonae]